MQEREEGDFDLVQGLAIPEYFVTTIGKTEHAGGGCVRVYNCIARDGLLIPQFTVVIPADLLIAAAEKVKAAAVDIFRMENLAGCLAH